MSSPSLIAHFDREQRRRRLQVEDPPAATGDRPLTAETRLHLAWQGLTNNQDFVTFVDSKANTLLLVNSIFLATAASAGPAGALATATLVGAAGVVLLCLGVVWTRSSQPAVAGRGELVFFEHVLRRRNAAAYLDDLLRVRPDELIECTARQVYELSGVVDRKLRAYRWAQRATAISAGLWIANLVSPSLAMG